MKLSAQLCGDKLEQVEQKIEMLIETRTGTFSENRLRHSNEDKGESLSE